MFPIMLPVLPLVGAMLPEVFWQATQRVLLDMCLERAIFFAP